MNQFIFESKTDPTIHTQSFTKLEGEGKTKSLNGISYKRIGYGVTETSNSRLMAFFSLVGSLFKQAFCCDKPYNFSKRWLEFTSGKKVKYIYQEVASAKKIVVEVNKKPVVVVEPVKLQEKEPIDISKLDISNLTSKEIIDIFKSKQSHKLTDTQLLACFQRVEEDLLLYCNDDQKLTILNNFDSPLDVKKKQLLLDTLNLKHLIKKLSCKKIVELQDYIAQELHFDGLTETHKDALQGHLDKIKPENLDSLFRNCFSSVQRLPSLTWKAIVAFQDYFTETHWNLLTDEQIDDLIKNDADIHPSQKKPFFERAFSFKDSQKISSGRVELMSLKMILTFQDNMTGAFQWHWLHCTDAQKDLLVGALSKINKQNLQSAAELLFVHDDIYETKKKRLHTLKIDQIILLQDYFELPVDKNTMINRSIGWGCLSDIQKKELFDNLEKIDVKHHRRILNTLFNDYHTPKETLQDRVQSLSFDWIIRLRDVFQYNHWGMVSEQQSVDKGWDSLEDVEVIKKVVDNITCFEKKQGNNIFERIFLTSKKTALDLLRSFTFKQILFLQEYLQDVHWALLTDNQKLELLANINKIPQDRQKKFFQSILPNADETKTLIAGFRNDEIFKFQSLFQDYHWQMIPDGQISDLIMDFDEVRGAQFVLDSIFNLDIDHQSTTQERIKNLSNEKVIQLKPYLNKNLLGILKESQKTALKAQEDLEADFKQWNKQFEHITDMSKVTKEQWKEVNRYMQSLLIDQIVMLQRNFNRLHWDGISDQQAIDIANKHFDRFFGRAISWIWGHVFLRRDDTQQKNLIVKAISVETLLKYQSTLIGGNSVLLQHLSKSQIQDLLSRENEIINPEFRKALALFWDEFKTSKELLQK